MNQAEMEALYSQRNRHVVLNESIRSHLCDMFQMFAIKGFYLIPNFLAKSYYDSKNARLIELKQSLGPGDLENLIVSIIATVIHSRSIMTIQQAVGYLSNSMPHEDTFDRAKTASELLAIMSDPNGLYEIQRNGSGVPATIEVHHWDYLEKKLLHNFQWINDTCFNPPLIEAPKEVTSNKRCGYHTLDEPLILGSLTAHTEKQDFVSINSLNKIEWVFDPDVLAEPEVPSKPPANAEAHLQFQDMVRSSNFIYKLLGQDPFWFCWQYDSRGRIYSHGYHVNLQSQEYKKALLNFNQQEMLT